MEDGGSSSTVSIHDCDSERPKNLEILQQYIEKQHEFLQRISSDVRHLHEIEHQCNEEPLGPFEQLANLLRGRKDADNIETTCFNLGTLSRLVEDVFDDEGGPLHSRLEWNDFKGRDPSLLRNLACSVRLSRCPTVFPPTTFVVPVAPAASSSKQIPPQVLPPIYPRPRDSSLRSLVQQQRARIVDPVLQRNSAYLATFPPDSDDDRGNDPHNRRKSKHETNAAAAIRPRGPGGVFVKRNVTESASHSCSSLKGGRFGDDSLICRSKRIRRPSTRALDAESALAARGSRRANSSGRSLRRSSRSSSVASTNKKEARLTIRIPARVSLGASGRGFPSTSSTSATASTSAGPSLRLPEERHSFSPTSTIFTQMREPSLLREHSVKLEEYSMQSINFESDDELLQEEEEVPDGDCVESVMEEEAPQASRTTRHILSNRNSKLDAKSVSRHKSNGRGGSYVMEDSHPGSVEPPAKGRKSKSDTFKQSWSVEEQHLLERLLEEYPDGVQKRWSSISQAMGGRRTPRQVASRVQKYFAKLKKFGVDMK